MLRNVRLYVWYKVCSGFFAWMPTFFLFFSEQLGLKEVLLLESIYYMAVVSIEVPSGYFSDVIGRKTTLIISSVFLVLACLFFSFGSSFLMLAIAQICFAGFMSFQSGTNTVFHYESLQAAGLAEEYGDREARIGKLTMMSAAVAALLGGFLGSYNLRWPFIATLFTASTALLIAIQFKEPEKESDGALEADNFLQQLKMTMAYLKQPSIAWLFGFFVLLYALVHVPYEFYQPYLKLLENRGDLPLGKAPILAGLMVAITSFIGAFVSGKSMELKNALGLKNLSIAALLSMLALIGIMGSALSPLMIALILFRNTPMAAIRAPFNEAITPLIAAGQRATFHSVLSLAGRLAFFSTLFGLSCFVAKDQITDWATLSALLRICTAVGFVLAIPILLLAGKSLAKSSKANP